MKATSRVKTQNGNGNAEEVHYEFAEWSDVDELAEVEAAKEEIAKHERSAEPAPARAGRTSSSSTPLRRRTRS